VSPPTDPVGAQLEVADALHALGAEWSRASVAALAGAARLLRGRPPVAWPHRGASRHEVAARRGNVTLRRYPAQRAPARAPILVVASLINKYYVMDLLPGLSVFEHLAGRGFEIWVLDWGAPGAAGRERTFADYVDDLIPWGVEQAGRSAGGGPVATLGYCMGGTMAAMFAARHPQAVRALALLGTPIDFQKSGLLALWSQRRWFDADRMVDAFGNVPPWLLQSAFKALAAADLPRKLTDLLERADDEAAVRHYVALESWLEDNVAFPGGVYRQYIRDCYQDNKLVRGQMVVGGKAIDLARITMPLLVVTALRDRICEPPSARALLERAHSREAKLLEFDTGHIGLTTSRRALAELWPQIADWLEVAIG